MIDQGAGNSGANTDGARITVAVILLPPGGAETVILDGQKPALQIAEQSRREQAEKGEGYFSESRQHGEAGAYAGSVCVYRLDGRRWVYDAELIADGAAVADLFGVAVIISGDTIILGPGVGRRRPVRLLRIAARRYARKP